MGHRRLGKDLQCLVVIHRMALQNAAVAVVCIFAQANVGDDIAVRPGRLDGPDTEDSARACVRVRDGKRVFYLGADDRLTPAARQSAIASQTRSGE